MLLRFRLSDFDFGFCFILELTELSLATPSLLNLNTVSSWTVLSPARVKHLIFREPEFKFFYEQNTLRNFTLPHINSQGNKLPTAPQIFFDDIICWPVQRAHCFPLHLTANCIICRPHCKPQSQPHVRHPQPIPVLHIKQCGILTCCPMNYVSSCYVLPGSWLATVRSPPLSLSQVRRIGHCISPHPRQVG